jgi:hypothetical protein
LFRSASKFFSKRKFQKISFFSEDMNYEPTFPSDLELFGGTWQQCGRHSLHRNCSSFLHADFSCVRALSSATPAAGGWGRKAHPPPTHQKRVLFCTVELWNVGGLCLKRNIALFLKGTVFCDFCVSCFKQVEQI